MLGIIEVKGYDASPSALARQIERHRDRLTSARCHVTLNDEGWLPWSAADGDEQRTIQAVFHLEGTIERIVVVPGGLNRRQDDFTVIPLPWNSRGLRAMATRFSLWLIENLGRIADPDDYDRGRDAWERLLMRFLEHGTGTARDRAMAERLLCALRDGGEDPDRFWTAWESLTERPVHSPSPIHHTAS